MFKPMHGLMCAAFCLTLISGSSAMAADSDQMYTYKVGEYELTLLSEGDSNGQAALLLGATPDQLRKYAPDGTFPMAANAFLLRTPERIILVDSAYGKKLFQQLETLGVAPEKIDSVLLTHMHPDHIGGLLRDGKVAFPNAKVYVAEQESGYWGDTAIMESKPAPQQGGFKGAQKILKAYGDNIQTFHPGALNADAKDLLPGITPVAAFGHTPGHTVFMVHSGDAKMLIWGDLTHAMAIQMPVPEVALTFDTDPTAAIASRLAILKYAADNNIPVAGMHVPYPAMGGIAAGQDDGFVFTPMK